MSAPALPRWARRAVTVPARAEVPRSEADLVEWLWPRWEALDAWVDEALTAGNGGPSVDARVTAS